MNDRLDHEDTQNIGPILTRPISPQDGERAAEIFFDAIHNAKGVAYTKRQRQAWAGDTPNPAAWMIKFKNVSGFAAELDGQMVGFMTLDTNGYIDLAFVRSDLAGCGIGRRLYDVIEDQAIQTQISKLTTEASIVAKHFFEQMGWRIDQKQTRSIQDIHLINYKMSKYLSTKP